MEKRLYRDELNKKIAGVCAGIAEYLNVDVTIVRVIFALTLVLKGGGALVYFVMWAVLPKKPYYLNNPHVDYTVPPTNDSFNPFKAGVPPQPLFAMEPKKASSAGLIAGIALVLFGSFFLLEQLDIIPFLSFHQIWPVILIIMGVMVIFSGKDKKPKSFEKEKWEGAEQTEENATTSADNNAANSTSNEQ